MRPKKRILLYCADADRLGRVAFVLDVRGFAPVPCDSVELALHEVDWGLQDAFRAVLLIGTDGCEGYDEMIVKMKARSPGLPVMIWAESPAVSFADLVLPCGMGVEVVIGRLKVLTSRKRGPKKRVAVGCELMAEPRMVAA